MRCTPPAPAAASPPLRWLSPAPPRRRKSPSPKAHRWSSGHSPVVADWIEITNFSSTVLDIGGCRIDDSSNSFASSVARVGITCIAPGESVIFIEGAVANANFVSAGSAPRRRQACRSAAVRVRA